MFESILGHEPIKTYLTQALAQNRLPHALLFAGLDGVGKTLFAKHLATTLLQTTLHRLETGNHPDFHPLIPEGKSGLHSIETLRSLIDEVHSASFEAPAKVFLIQDADRMQPAAANALLKTLEEPTPDTILILLTSAPTEILPTILSRCIRLTFHPLSESDIGTLLRERGHPETLAKRSHGSIGRACEYATQPSLEEPLFSLLSQRHSHVEMMERLEKIEELIEDEDPLRKHRNIEAIFQTILMWWRDQTIHSLGLSPSLLFFPQVPPVSHPLASLETIQKAIQEARLAVSRNIRLSVSLHQTLCSNLTLS